MKTNAHKKSTVQQPQRKPSHTPTTQRRAHPTQLVQRFKQSTQSLTPQELGHLQHSLGNKGMIQLLRSIPTQEKNGSTHSQSSPRSINQQTPFTTAPRPSPSPLQRKKAPLVPTPQPNQTILQRSISPRARTAFSFRFQNLLNRLSLEGALTETSRGEIVNLSQMAALHNNWLRTEVPHMARQLSVIRELLPGRKFSSKQPSAVVTMYLPREQKRNYKAVSAGTFTPKVKGGDGVDGGGQLENSEMIEREQEEIGLLRPNEGDTSDVFAQARINLAIEEIDKVFHYNRAQSVDGLGIDPNQVLTTFVGPEWYFRRPDRPYTIDERNLIIKTFTIVSKSYPDMVIMPGTVVWAEGNQLDGWTNFTNSAPVFYNGKYITRIDKSADCGDTNGLVHPDKFSEQAKRQDGSSLFNIGNLNFALDICADHHSERAKTEYLKTHGKKSLRKGQGLDVHLVTGAGQISTSSKLALHKGGLAISSDSTGSGSDLKTVTQGTSTKSSGILNMGTTEVSLEAKTQTVTEKLTESQDELTTRQKKMVGLMKDKHGEESETYQNYVAKIRRGMRKPVTMFYRARLLAPD